MFCSHEVYISGNSASRDLNLYPRFSLSAKIGGYTTKRPPVKVGEVRLKKPPPCFSGFTCPTAVGLTASVTLLSCSHIIRGGACAHPLRHPHSLSPNSDLSQTSHCSIKGLLVREVVRIVNMITQVKYS